VLSGAAEFVANDTQCLKLISIKFSQFGKRGCRRTKYNTSIRQNAGIQQKLVATYKQHAS
jgi:hypothetical protein